MVQRQLWNLLLAHANDKMHEEIHSIPVRLLFAERDFALDHYDELKTHLEALVNTTVKWNLYNKDKRSWGAMTFLASAYYNAETGMLEWSYSGHLREMLRVPKKREELRTRPYLKIPVEVQNKFKSKHAQFLYEFLMDCYNPKRKETHTNWISVESYEEMCGTSYGRWDKIKERLVEKPYSEIGHLLPFKAVMQHMKATNRTTHIRFRLVRKTQQEMNSPHFPEKDPQ